MKTKTPTEKQEDWKEQANYNAGFRDGLEVGQKQTNEEVLKLIDKRIRKLKRCKDVEWENRLSIEVLEQGE